MVPSIEEHGQNEHHNGVLFLVRTIVNAFQKVVAADCDRARALAVEWRAWLGRLGPRLSLRAMRDAAAFAADETLDFMLELEETDFWVIRREFALVVRDRVSDASSDVVATIEERIRISGKAYYEKYSIEEGQVDWRERASVHHIVKSEAPEKFPLEVLDLLWLVFGLGGASSHDMGKVLDRLVAADPTIEVDRRFQSLEHRTTRYS